MNTAGGSIVSVLANLSDRAADAALQRTLWWLGALFGVLFLLLNVAFFFFGRLEIKLSQPPKGSPKGSVNKS